ncbi:MAG: hypothetical protein D8B38_02290 [Candidatus Saccharimonas sp.]|nr:MAG: hypothetical protein D8B38_02290 [Candidatus Saccharimonas sp.]
MKQRKKTIIGRNIKIHFSQRMDVPAKVDTGAYSSAVWASNIRVGKDGVLRFSLFGEGSPYYTGKLIKRTEYSVAAVRSASGHQIIKYRTYFTVRIGGRKIRVLFGLSDRSLHNFPVLIGRRALHEGRFLVDVCRSEIDNVKQKYPRRLNQELKRNPYEFYKKYHKGRSEK